MLRQYSAILFVVLRSLRGSAKQTWSCFRCPPAGFQLIGLFPWTFIGYALSWTKTGTDATVIAANYTAARCPCCMEVMHVRSEWADPVFGDTDAHRSAER